MFRSLWRLDQIWGKDCYRYKRMISYEKDKYNTIFFFGFRTEVVKNFKYKYWKNINIICENY